VKLLTNPLFLRMVLLLFAAALAFIIGIFMVRRVRHSLTEEQALLHESSSSAEKFPVHTYHAVIQQLKQQKHELTALQQMERRRAKATENINIAVLSNLSSGVLFFDTNGLVRQSNHAAKNILGYASPIGMNADEIFRAATLHTSAVQENNSRTLAEAVRSTLRDRLPLCQIESEYVTPGGEERVLDVTVSPVTAADGSSLGAACLISDQTQIAELQRQQDARGEVSAEMALELRNSLTTITGYAQQLAQNCDPDVARQLTADIIEESVRLDRTIGGFLASAKPAKVQALHGV